MNPPAHTHITETEQQSSTPSFFFSSTIPNRSLQDALLDRRCPELMRWANRFDVAVSVAKGLEYLHHNCDPPVIHGDIKPGNVLLDRDFKAKIGDFGLARVKSAVEDSGNTY